MSIFQIDTGCEWRGGQRQSFFLARELKKQGYAFQFIVQPESPLFQKASECGLPILPLRIKSELDLLAAFRLGLLMKRRGCRLAHFHDAHAVAVGSMACSLARVPIRVISRRVDFPLKKNFISRRKYTKNIDAIIAISEGVKQVLVQGGIASERVEVIPSGIDFTPFEEVATRDFLRREFAVAPDDFLVGIVAHLEDHKGHRYLIEATRILKEHTPKIKLIIVGKGSLRMELTKQVKRLQVEDLVFFLGFREDIPQILASLDVFVLSSYLEGMGSSLLDAMASRLPVVATRVGGIPEVVLHGKTGLLVSTRNPAALAQAILKLYNDRRLARKLGEEGYEVVHRKYSAAAMAGRVIELYEKLASKKGVQLPKETMAETKELSSPSQPLKFY
ncbi:MAG: glycosyltransferase family 4 protein [Candidatus Aminicenantales bacterium]